MIKAIEVEYFCQVKAIRHSVMITLYEAVKLHQYVKETALYEDHHEIADGRLLGH